MSSGTVAIWALKDNDYYATEFPGTVAGLQAAITYAATSGGGIIYLGPGTIDCGTTTLTVPTSLSGTLQVIGSGERATILSYTGTGRFIVLGADDGDHSGSADSYAGTIQFRLKDVKLAGPGETSTATGVTDWENGSARYENVFFDQWLEGYFGIGADVVTFDTCLFNKCGKGAFVATRSDQNTFRECYFSLNTIGANIEYATGTRFVDCQFVFSDTSDIVFDAPATPTQNGEARTDAAAWISGCWFESTSSPTVTYHVNIGTNGSSSRRYEAVFINNCYLLAVATTNFVNVEAANIVRLENVYQAGTITGALLNVTTVSGLTQEVSVKECRVNGGTFFGGTASATQALLYRARNTSSNAFAASFTPNALSGEIIEVGALTADITINAPTSPVRGQFLLFKLQQDGTGGRTVTWNSVFKHWWSDAGNNLASATATARFYYDGTNWQQISGRGWTDTSNRSTLPTRKGADLASGATLTPGAGNVFVVTGTADITSITANTEDAGRVIWLIFSGTAATTGVTDGSNLKMAGNFGYSPDDTMCLVCDGTNWYEVSRSAN